MDDISLPAKPRTITWVLAPSREPAIASEYIPFQEDSEIIYWTLGCQHWQHPTKVAYHCILILKSSRRQWSPDIIT